MSIFKRIGKSLKKAAPLIGAGIGYYFGGPLMGAQLGTALGAGIGTLAGGGDIEDALLAGTLGYGAGSLASSAGIGMSGAAAAKTGATAQTLAGTKAMGMGPAQAQAMLGSGTQNAAAVQQLASVPMETAAGGSSILGGIGDFMADNKMLTAGLGVGALGLLAGEEPEQEQLDIPETREGRPYETKVRGPITGTIYNLANKDERMEYNNELLQLRDENFKYEAGGEVNGPGTGTSDSVPARLSDGEFVLTAKAVRGAGNGDRDIGAARMYDMMAELESMA